MTESIINPGPHLVSAAGLAVDFNANGSLRRFDCEAVSLTLFGGSELEGGPANIYLRRLTDTVECHAAAGAAQSNGVSV